jgi:diguanylate cyclase (GGDEF)-like protein
MPVTTGPVHPDAHPVSQPDSPVGPAERLLACLALADPTSGTPPAEACQAAREAMALAALLPRPLERARAGAWLCSQLLRLGRHAEVLKEAPTQLALLNAPQVALALSDDKRELMRVLTMSACETGDFDLALDTAHELVRLTGPLGEAGASLEAAYSLGVCFERMGDSWQAMRVISRALQTHGDAAPDRPLLIMRNALCAISIGLFHRLNGAAEPAEVQRVLARAQEAGEQALALLQRMPDAVYDVAIRGNLGEVLLHQGALDRAAPLLARAQAGAAERGLQAYAWRLQATLGDWHLARDEPAIALAAMQQLLHDMGDAAPQQTAIRAHHAAYRACRALGQFEAGLRHFEAFEKLERQRATSQLRAQSELFVTRTEAQHAQWQAEQARMDAQTQRARAAEFAARAERDPLTGLGNRRHFDRRCAELLPALQREGRPVVLALIDVDRFKSINDLHGHAVGDRVLVALAQLLRDNMRTRDVLARHGGEEFVVVLPGMTLAQAAEVCERLRERVAAHLGFADMAANDSENEAGSSSAGPLRVTVSLGLAAAPPYDVAQLLQRADIQLYRAKREGRNRLCLAA